jgi:methylase of polypeptide subunit release factors
VREYEPIFTLTDQSDDGLGLMRRAVGESVEWLKPGGWLLLEMSHDLPAKIRRLIRKAGLEDHGVARDDDDLSVVVEARKTPEPRRGSR